MKHEQRNTIGTQETGEAAGPQRDSRPGPDVRRGPGPDVMSAGTIVGNHVRNNSDEELGDVKEIMLDMRSGRVGYAVMSSGTFLGMGGKLFAVPWNALKLDTEKRCFVLDVDKDRLRNAPGFDKDHWPDMADQSWAREIHSYYGTRPYSEEQHVV